MMRVTNWQRWQRFKVVLAVLAFVVALSCAGGLESTGAEPIPSRDGFIASMTVLGLLAWSINKHRQS